MNTNQLRYAETHEWALLNGDIATIGITAHAVEQLTDLVYMDLPKIGSRVSAGSPFGEVESVKATSDLYSPVDGEVVEVNSTLPDNLELLNSDPYSAGWIMKVKVSDKSSLNKLMDLAAYEKMCADH